MDLVCYELITENKAIVDPTLLRKKVFQYLLQNEESSVVTYCDIQKEITFEMRKIVIVWMKEVTEEQKCQPEVFLLAVNYMNRFLNVCQIRRNQLQLLGTACMFIASKLRETAPLNASLLIFYTDNSITLYELLRFEQLVLSKLKWDISVVTPLDFLQYIILTISIEPLDHSISKIDERAKALISYCACEQIFWRIPPSLIAASCLASALLAEDRLMKHSSKLNSLLDEICNMTNIELDNSELTGYLQKISRPERSVDSLQIHLKYVENIIERIRRTVSGKSEQSDYAATDSRKDEFTTPPPGDKSVEIETATTPTDVHNIDF